MYFTQKNIMLPTHYDFFFIIYITSKTTSTNYTLKKHWIPILTLKTFHMTFDKK